MNFSRRTTSIAVFAVIAFGIPWSTWIVLRMRHVSFTEGTPLAFMIGAAFCSVGGLAATYIETGTSGVKDLLRRCVLYRVRIGWWLYALFLALGVHAVATIIYGEVHGGVGPVRPFELFRQWWFFFVFVFGLFQGPLAEELGWRGFLLPRLLSSYSPLGAAVIVGLVWAGWHIEMFQSPVSTIALFTASTIALSILMTVLFLRTRGSVLLAIVLHWSVVPAKEVARISFPAAPEPPDWLRAGVVITVAVIVAVTMGKRLTLRSSA